jgi:hypothetical protein
VRPGVIDLRFGDPIPTDGRTSDERNALARQAREAVVGLMHPNPQA